MPIGIQGLLSVQAVRAEGGFASGPSKTAVCCRFKQRGGGGGHSALSGETNWLLYSSA